MLMVMQGLPEALVLHLVLQPGQKPGLVGLLMMFTVYPEGIHLAFHAGELAPQGDGIDPGHEAHQEDQGQNYWYNGNDHGSSLAIQNVGKTLAKV
jgi:hypothetical protein